MFSVFDEQVLRKEFQLKDIKPLHVYTLWTYLLAHEGVEAHHVPGLPQAAYPLLSSKFKTLSSHVQAQTTSADASTTKLLIGLQSGQSVEAVIMRHDSSCGKYAGAPRSKRLRATVCVSSQVGCKMGCAFCATGTMGFKANLSAGEIVEQLVHAARVAPIRNVVFMGMGEPLNNYSAVVQAVRTMMGGCFGLSPNHITISTVGVIPYILSLAHDLPGVRLAVSLHAPTQELRRQIVPASRAFSLEKLIEALSSYQSISKQTIFVEYVLLAGINDATENAHDLGKVLRKLKVVVNLIPYNQAFSVEGFKASTQEDVFHFQKVVRENYGIRTTVRQEMGRDIQGACGQLALQYTDTILGTKLRSEAGLNDIEDLYQISP